MKTIYKDFQESSFYPVSKLIYEVLVHNLAFVMHGEILEKGPRHDIQISSIQADLITFTVEPQGEFDLHEFTVAVEVKSYDYPISYFSVSMTTLDVVFSKLLQKENFAADLIRKTSLVRRNTKRQLSSQNRISGI